MTFSFNRITALFILLSLIKNIYATEIKVDFFTKDDLDGGISKVINLDIEGSSRTIKLKNHKCIVSLKKYDDNFITSRVEVIDSNENRAVTEGMLYSHYSTAMILNNVICSTTLKN